MPGEKSPASLQLLQSKKIGNLITAVSDPIISMSPTHPIHSPSSVAMSALRLLRWCGVGQGASFAQWPGLWLVCYVVCTYVMSPKDDRLFVQDKRASRSLLSWSVIEARAVALNHVQLSERTTWGGWHLLGSPVHGACWLCEVTVHEGLLAIICQSLEDRCSLKSYPFLIFFYNFYYLILLVHYEYLCTLKDTNVYTLGNKTKHPWIFLLKKKKKVQTRSVRQYP